MYYRDQFEKAMKLSKEQYGEDRKAADYVLKLEGHYDIGFVFNKETMQYDMIYDNHQKQISWFLGEVPEKGDDPRAMETAKLTNLYIKHAAINDMVSKGYSIESETTDEFGNYHIELAAPAYVSGY